MELPENQIQRTYRVRVYGRFDEEKLKKIRAGAIIKGKQYGPFWVNFFIPKRNSVRCRKIPNFEYMADCQTLARKEP